MFAAGTVLAGKYRVDRVLGQGGMGTVVAATHLTLGQQVALKLLLPEYVNNVQIVERFVREARASAALRGEHVCRVSDVGALDDGTPYIVMELLEGSDLAGLVAAHGPMPVQLACDYLLQGCVGAAEAHALGIVHRDLKPANLFLTQRPDGTPLIKVLDFGIAKAQSDTNFSLTRTASVMGSPGYMSPEQLRSSRDVDARSDIWSLGVILFELVSGMPPFRAESITELAIRVTLDPMPPLVGQMPNGFDEIVSRCLAKDPAQRYPDLAHLAHALAAFASPGGWELANRVARLLSGAKLSTAGMVPLTAPAGGVSPHGGVSPTGPQHGMPPTSPPVPGTGSMPPVSGYGAHSTHSAHSASSAHNAPTTIGCAASSSVVTERGGRSRTARWGIIAGAAVVVIGAGVGIMATRGDDRAASSSSSSAAPAVPAEPAPQPAAAEPAAAVAVPAVPAIATPAPVAVDAAVAAAPPDVPAEPAASKPESPQQPDKPAKPSGRPGKPASKPSGGQDFGESRY
ncbi:MAG TPA: serine/threonine-protein kinase [Kofleriaceae bacterium]|nr:serine/threonine-protein kinase [Kofleriaceae bacterium]